MDGQLAALYSVWKQNPKSYNAELSITIDKIINKVTKGMSFNSIHGLEDKDDLMQELRLACIKAFYRIEAPYTNKRIYNFLKSSIIWHLKIKNRKLSKHIIRKPLEAKILAPKKFELSIFEFGDNTINEVAYLFGQGYTKTEVCKELKLTKYGLNKIVNKLREILKS